MVLGCVCVCVCVCVYCVTGLFLDRSQSDSVSNKCDVPCIYLHYFAYAYIMYVFVLVFYFILFFFGGDRNTSKISRSARTRSRFTPKVSDGRPLFSMRMDKLASC